MANKRNKKQPLKRAGAIKKTKGKKKVPKAAAKAKVEKVAVKKGKQNAVTTAATTEKSNVEPKEKEKHHWLRIMKVQLQLVLSSE
uniref:Uncharacterized protein n=1 Tax=Ditylenchus dipsaci TaxID=166011 RepID=A0A915E5E2_9BILA